MEDWNGYDFGRNMGSCCLGTFHAPYALLTFLYGPTLPMPYLLSSRYCHTPLRDETLRWPLRVVFV